MKKLAILASGSGTNADRIIAYFKNRSDVQIDVLLCNKPGAGAFDVAEKHGVESVAITRSALNDSDAYSKLLIERGVDYIILAGFLLKVPPHLLEAFPDKILNIHPALLPKYGGKGMYGMNVHNAVVDNHESESGMTIHLVNGQYDEGAIVFQASCPVAPSDNAADVAKKVQALEHAHFPRVIDVFISHGS